MGRRGTRHALAVVGAIIMGLLGLAPASVGADGAWLDQPLVSWNEPGMAVPVAPPPDGAPPDPRCVASQRPPETAEDWAAVGAGWNLFSTYEAGWGIKVFGGLVGYDGMCRPWVYQYFVFVDGAFAGTISPVAMASRTDGGGGFARILSGGAELTAQFARYSETDPLCCPSRSSTVRYRIDRAEGGPVLVPFDVRTAATGQS